VAKKRAVKKAAAKSAAPEFRPDDPALVVNSVMQSFPISGTKLPPIYRKDGEFNPDYLTAAYACLVGSVTEAVMTGDKPPSSLNEAIKTLETIARIHGFELERVADKRTPEQIQFDTAMRLIDAPESLLEQTEEMLEQLEKTMMKAVSMSNEYINSKISVAKSAMDVEFLRNGPDGGAKIKA
jgi:hypothetical protein